MNYRLAKERIEKLKKEIRRYRYAYHVLDKEEISAEALDSLKKELFDLEQQFSDLVTPDSPTQRIGGRPLKAFKKVRHEQPMLSFNDAFSEQDMKDWLERIGNYLKTRISKRSAFYCELKIDGLAIELVYENGILVRGSTRGDGIIGEDITQNLKTIEAIPLRLEVRGLKFEVPRRLVVRGEVFLTKKEFSRINREQKKEEKKVYANPRNVAAGSVRQLDPKIMASRKLDSFQYDVVTDFGQKTHQEEHQILKAFGFKTNPYNKLAHSLQDVFKIRNYWEKHRDKLPYEIDGIVVIVNDDKIFELAGVVGKAPRAAIAYKFSPKETTTVVQNIKIQVGRTGALTPVAELKPVTVGGITISHATLHNYDEIKRLGIKIGDTVIVSRAGDVIPQVTKVLKHLRNGQEKNFLIPRRCPVDGSKIIQDGVIYRCSNPQCGARHRELLRHFVSRSAFDIRGLGIKVIDRFLNEGLITDAADFFILQEDDIAVLERFGKKSAQNIVQEIQAHKKISLPRFLYSLGILHIGEETARLLADKFQSMEVQPRYTEVEPRKIGKVFKKFTLEKLQEIPDIGPRVAQSIYNWFRESHNIKFLRKLEKVGIKIENQKLKVQIQKLTHQTFVLTGTLDSLSREEAKRKIRQLGGNVSESVSQKTDYVVIGENPGAKYEKAKKIGIKIIKEKEFLKMI